MPYVTVGKENGANIDIYYKDWGKGQPIVFSHGWPLSADDWDAQMLFFLNRDYRVIAHDRRGHGRSSQTADGHDMDHYADDLAALTANLDLKNAIHVGHSTGGGEVVHYLGRHGESRVACAAIISAVPPLMVKTAANGAAVVELLKVLLRMVSESHHVAAKVIATVDDLERLAADDDADVPALTGWRRELFGEKALALKHGRLALAIENGRVTVVER